MIVWKGRRAFVLLLLSTAVGIAAGAQTPRLDLAIQASDAFSYATGTDGSVYTSVDRGLTWQDRSEGLPVKVVYPFTDETPRRITALSYDPTDLDRVAVSTGYGAYTSSDRGVSWIEIPLARPIKPVDHITAIAISPHSEKTIFIGTSFNGFFSSSDGGRTWLSETESIKHLYRGAGFYEEIAAIAISPDRENHVFLAAGFGGGVYESEDSGRSWNRLAIPSADDLGEIAAMSFTKRSEEDWALRIHGAAGNIWLHEADDSWQILKSPFDEVPAAERVGRADAMRRRIVRTRTGIYVNAAWTEGDRLETHLDLLAEHGMDSVVVDMKDDAGRLTYDTELTLPQDIGAVNVRFTLGELLTTAHSAGVYVIGRIVVFQDPKLYRYANAAYAIWDSGKDEAWGNLREHWVDPYSEFVWKYNVAIADELQRRGVDEIQFDYIRFPSDGDLSRTEYRYKRPGMSKVDAIESFLRLAREKITIPISTDLYGFNSWFRMGNWIGQNIDVIADYVDVVCPMFYPSHFPPSFMGDLDFFDRAREIYEVGGFRAARIAGGRIIVRPYVQAFLIGSERSFDEPEYSLYLSRQLEGVIASRESGFTLWNASNSYYMVTESLVRFTKEGDL